MLKQTYAAEIEQLLSRYASPRSAVLPLLYIAQDHYGTLSQAAIQEVADVLGLPATDVFEVVGFYTLFYDRPVGRWMVQVCDDVPCCYCGAEELIEVLKHQLGISEEQTSNDGMVTLQRVKCLAACHRPPVVQANLSYFYDVTAERADAFIRFLREHAESQQAQSVSGHAAEDYEPDESGGFRLIERRLVAYAAGNGAGAIEPEPAPAAAAPEPTAEPAPAPDTAPPAPDTAPPPTERDVPAQLERRESNNGTD